MGMYSYFRLQASEPDRIEEFAEWLDKRNWGHIRGDQSFHIEETKWYRCEEDMLALSKTFPTVAFTLDRIYEDPYSKETWTLLALGGVLQKQPLILGEMHSADLSV